MVHPQRRDDLSTPLLLVFLHDRFAPFTSRLIHSAQGKIKEREKEVKALGGRFEAVIPPMIAARILLFPLSSLNECCSI
jgi:hypothetical protein